MIFVTVGTQLPFDRLVRGVDAWAAKNPHVDVRTQIGTIGTDGYQPGHMKSTPSIPPLEYDALCREADLIVAHAGTGSFIKALEVGTPILAMPRRGDLGEHRNDHQLATAAHFDGRGGIHIVHEADDIGTAIDQLLGNGGPAGTLQPYADETLLSTIRDVIFPATQMDRGPKALPAEGASAGLSVIIPANNEAGYIGPCLDALVQQTGLSGATAEIIVAANNCSDTTIHEAEDRRPALLDAGWALTVLDIETPGKLNALNTAEVEAQGDVLVYLDADVICEPAMMAALLDALDTDSPRYASGHLMVAKARSFITRRFAATWQRLPFMTSNVQGAGLFAVNCAGRARWDAFPQIIADDAYVRLMFAPDERIKVDAVYHWPMVEGFRALVKVRRRQDAGVRELVLRYPEIMANESKPPMGLSDHWSIFRQGPLSYVVYVAVMVAVKASKRKPEGWTRGR